MVSDHSFALNKVNPLRQENVRRNRQVWEDFVTFVSRRESLQRRRGHEDYLARTAKLKKNLGGEVREKNKEKGGFFR